MSWMTIALCVVLFLIVLYFIGPIVIDLAVSAIDLILGD